MKMKAIHFVGSSPTRLEILLRVRKPGLGGKYTHNPCRSISLIPEREPTAEDLEAIIVRIARALGGDRALANREIVIDA